MSKRSKRRRDPRTAGNEGTRDAQRAGEGIGPRDGSGGSRGRPAETPRAGRGRSGAATQDRGASSWNLPLQIAFVIAVFAVVSLIAELAGAANLGVALGVGQVAFAIAVIYLLVRR